jgi:hypothetical protein
VTREQEKFVAAVKALDAIAHSDGFNVFLDAVMDELATGASFALGAVRERWTLGEEFAYRLGMQDAAFKVCGREGADGLRERLLKAAKAILDKDAEAQNGSAEPEEPPQYQ